jgi:hypothetical protein
MKVIIPSEPFELEDPKTARILFYQHPTDSSKSKVRIRFNETFSTLAKIRKGNRFILKLDQKAYSRKNKTIEYDGKLITTLDPEEGFSVWKNKSQYLQLDDTHLLSTIIVPSKIKNCWFSFKDVKVHINGDISFSVIADIEI